MFMLRYVSIPLQLISMLKNWEIFVKAVFGRNIFLVLYCTWNLHDLRHCLAHCLALDEDESSIGQLTKYKKLGTHIYI